MEQQKSWWQKSVVYQIYPKSFCDSNRDGIGDINGIRSKLWYLKKLGVDVLWISPMYPSPNADNGYDISDYYGVSPDYGSLDELKALIRECQDCGIRIVFDLVVNHTSDEHPWFLEAKKSRDSTYRDYYIWRDGVDGGLPNDLTSNFGGSAWEYSEETGQYYLHFYNKKQPDLNWENVAMRKDLWAMMNYWIDMGISGFRMDVIDLIGKVPDRKIKENGPKLHEYLQEMNREALHGKNLLTVGECWGATPEIGRLYSDPARNELSMIFQFEHCCLDNQPGGSRWDLKPLELTDLKEVFSRWQTELEGHGWNSLFWGNHDLPRAVSRWGNDGALRVESAKMLATLLHGMKGTPYIFQGEEIGMTNVPFDKIEDFSDVETQGFYQELKQKGWPDDKILRSFRAKARDNARTPMQWTAGANAGFTDGTPWLAVNPNHTEINAEQALSDQDSIFYHYQALIRLRKQEPVLIYGVYQLLAPDDEQVYAYTRTLGEQQWLVVCNFYERPARFSYAGYGEIILSNYADSTAGNLDGLTLRPYEAVIYRIKTTGGM